MFQVQQKDISLTDSSVGCKKDKNIDSYNGPLVLCVVILLVRSELKSFLKHEASTTKTTPFSKQPLRSKALLHFPNVMAFKVLPSSSKTMSSSDYAQRQWKLSQNKTITLAQVCQVYEGV